MSENDHGFTLDERELTQPYARPAKRTSEQAPESAPAPQPPVTGGAKPPKSADAKAKDEDATL